MKIGKRILSIAGILALSLFLTACPPTGTVTPSPDIFVESIEVTQAIQSVNNNVNLVSERSTTVRVRVGVAGGGSAGGVTGVLRIFIDGNEITSSAGIAPINPGFTAPEAALWDRDIEDHTLNFEIPAPTDIVPTTNADFEVRLTPLANEPDATNNTGSADDLTVVQSISPKLYFTRINYLPAGAGLPAMADVQAGVGDAFVDGIYPVDDSDTNLYRAGLFPTLPWNDDPNGNGQIDSSNNEHSDILDWLETCRQLIVDAEGNGDSIFLYGWIEGNPISGNGWAPINGRVAFGNTQQTRHQRTYAHELGHNFGLSHNSRVLNPNTGWDTGGRLDGNPPGNNTAGRVKPSTLSDIMRGGLLTNQAWVDQTTYEYFQGHIVFDPSGTGSPDKRYQERAVAVSGVLSPDGVQLERLNPVFRYPWPTQASTGYPEDEYGVFVETESGNTYQTTFSGRLGDDSDTTKDFYGFFSVRMAVPTAEEIVLVSVVSFVTDATLGTLKRNKAPQLQILAPLGGSELSGDVTVKFVVEDPDTRLDQIRVQIAYSNDNGLTWVPVAVNVLASTGGATFDAGQVQTSKDGSGVIRVIASDGLNTVYQDVQKLTVIGR